jgi:hypothetical protein
MISLSFTHDERNNHFARVCLFVQSSAVVLGSRKIWRVDPTGQFWDCQATVLGADADKTEEDLYRRLLQVCEERNLNPPEGNVRELLDSMPQREALELAEDFLKSRLLRMLSPSSKPQPQQDSPQSPTTESSSQQGNTDESAMKSSDDAPTPNLSSQIHWQAVILDYSSLTRRGTPRRKVKRGIFGIRDKV